MYSLNPTIDPNPQLSKRLKPDPLKIKFEKTQIF
jgi:hypothetical protein